MKLRDAGGYGTDDYGQSNLIFRDKNDPDYKAILAAIYAAKDRMEKISTCRHESSDFRPNAHYIRWMKKWEILSESFNLDKDPINVYETDKAYWRLK